MSGYVECVEDQESKRKTVEKFPFLRKRIEEHGYGYLCIFRLRSGRALVWTRDADEAPGEKCYIDLG